MKDASVLKQLSVYDVDAWLLDSWVPGKAGGTGERFNWDLAVYAKESARPIVLAGGLKPENVAQAVHQVWPYAVDVSSGVEESVGKKSHAAMRNFVSAVRELEREKM